MKIREAEGNSEKRVQALSRDADRLSFTIDYCLREIFCTTMLQQ